MENSILIIIIVSEMRISVVMDPTDFLLYYYMDKNRNKNISFTVETHRFVMKQRWVNNARNVIILKGTVTVRLCD